MTLKIALVGSAGRMGREIRSVAAEFPEVEIVAAVVSPRAERDPSDLVATTDLKEAVTRANLVIDFSSPRVAPDLAQLCAQEKKPLLIGTTGLSEEDRAVISKAAEATAVLLAPNTSLGVFVLHELATTAQRLLGPSFDVELLEIHHRLKADAPSGTGLSVATQLADDNRVLRLGSPHGKRNQNEIGVASLRGGSVAGDHTVYFLGKGERIEITHRAESRAIFARGALVMALRLRALPAGLYAPRDIFSSHSV